MNFEQILDNVVQLPLNVDLELAAQAESVQTYRTAQVAEHRLDDPEAPTVLMPAFRGVDLPFHFMGIGFRCVLRPALEEVDLPGGRLFGASQALPTLRAGHTG